MASLNTIQRPQGISSATEVETNAPVSIANLDSEKGNAVETSAEPEDLKDFPNEVPDFEAQHGVQKIEAVTLSWTKASLAALLIKYVILICRKAK